MDGFPYSVTLPVYSHQMQNNPFRRLHTVLICSSYLGKFLCINRRNILYHCLDYIPCDDVVCSGYNNRGWCDMELNEFLFSKSCQNAFRRQVRESGNCARRPFPGYAFKVRTYFINLPTTYFKRPLSFLGGKLTWKQCELQSSSKTHKFRLLFTLQLFGFKHTPSSYNFFL